jgi:hypothetical protein
MSHNTKVVLPPGPSLAERVKLLVTVMVGFGLMGAGMMLLWHALETPVGAPASPQQSVTAPSELPPPDSPEIVVRAILELPSPTPVVDPTPRPKPTGTVAPNYCHPTDPPGTVCRMEPPPPPEPTPLPSCDFENPLMANTMCVIPTPPVATPQPAPTNQPPPPLAD